MTVDLENFIEEQYRQYITEGEEPNQDYIGLYEDITNEMLSVVLRDL